MSESGLKQLLQQSGLYLLANLSLKASGLILYVFYLGQLSQDAIGHFGLLDASAKMMMMLGGLGIAQGLIKYMTDVTVAEEQHLLPFTAWIASLCAGIGVFILFIGAAPWLASFLVDDASRTDVIFWMGAYVAFKVIGTVPMTVFRIQERVGWFVLATATELVLLVAGVYYFLVLNKLGLVGIYYAFAGSAGLTALVVVGLLLIQSTRRFEMHLLRQMLTFGLPLIAASLATIILNVGDRYLIKWLMDAKAVALYDLAARIGGTFNLLIVQSFQLAFAIIGLKRLTQQEEGPRFYRRTFRHYVVGAGWAVLGLSLLAFDLIRLIPAQANYEAAQELVFPYTLGFLMYGVYYIVMNILYGSGASRTITGLVLATALLNVVLNLILIPIFGILGAAWATCASYALLAGITHQASKRYLRIQFAWPTLWAVLTIVVLLYALALPSLEWSAMQRLTARVAILLSYPILILSLGLYSRSELVQVLNRIWPK